MEWYVCKLTVIVNLHTYQGNIKTCFSCTAEFNNNYYCECWKTVRGNIWNTQLHCFILLALFILLFFKIHTLLLLFSNFTNLHGGKLILDIFFILVIVLGSQFKCRNGWSSIPLMTCFNWDPNHATDTFKPRLLICWPTTDP